MARWASKERKYGLSSGICDSVTACVVLALYNGIPHAVTVRNPIEPTFVKTCTGRPCARSCFAIVGTYEAYFACHRYLFPRCRGACYTCTQDCGAFQLSRVAGDCSRIWRAYRCLRRVSGGAREPQVGQAHFVEALCACDCP